MIRKHFKNDGLSLQINFTDDEDEEDTDLITIQLDQQIIQVHYSQLSKYSQLIREEYLFSDVQNCLPQELKKFQQENSIQNFSC